MEPFTTLRGIVAPLDALNVDTDQILPKQFLKRIERNGYENFLFHDWRFLPGGRLNPHFEMNAPRYQNAQILLTKENFGCGSSREHAPWALQNYGFRVILAISFADIFWANCFNNGILPIALPAGTIQALFHELRATEGYELTITLPSQEIIQPGGGKIRFDIPPFKKQCLLNGWDPISLTLRHEEAIAAYEKKHGIA